MYQTFCCKKTMVLKLSEPAQITTFKMVKPIERKIDTLHIKTNLYK